MKANKLCQNNAKPGPPWLAVPRCRLLQIEPPVHAAMVRHEIPAGPAECAGVRRLLDLMGENRRSADRKRLTVMPGQNALIPDSDAAKPSPFPLGQRLTPLTF